MEAELSGARKSGVEWPTVAVAALAYSLWFAAGAWLWGAAPPAAIALMAIACALHSSLCHEATHGHPTRNAALNEAMVFLPLTLVWPFRRFKALHLRHHFDERLTDPFDDPESYYRALWQYESLPRWLRALLAVNNSLVGRIVLGPVFGVAGLVAGDWRQARDGDRRVVVGWLLHGVGLCGVAAIALTQFAMPLWALALAAWAGLGIISVRTFAEHRWSERPDGRTIIVERSPLSFLFLNNNLHLVHHKHPNVAWYRLPMLFKARRAEWAAMNAGYVVPNYWTLFREYAFRSKEPVVHPVLRRAPESGRAFRPSVRSQSAASCATPVPAKPPGD